MSIFYFSSFARELQVYTSIAVVPELYSGEPRDSAGDNKSLDMHIFCIMKQVNLILINFNGMFQIRPSVSVLNGIVWSTIFVAYNNKRLRIRKL
jgi:hypothetical protein